MPKNKGEKRKRDEIIPMTEVRKSLVQYAQDRADDRGVKIRRLGMGISIGLGDSAEPQDAPRDA